MSFKAKEGEIKKGVGAATQHRVVAGPNEVACQGCCRHAAMAYNCTGLCLSDRRTPQCGAAQIYNKRGSPGHNAKAQGLGRDQVGPGRKPHAHIASAQVEVVVIIQGGQGGRQVHLLGHS